MAFPRALYHFKDTKVVTVLMAISIMILLQSPIMCI